MDDGVGVPADALHRAEVTHVGLEDLDRLVPGIAPGPGRQAGHRPDDAEVVAGAGGEIVDDPDLDAALAGGDDEIASNEAAPSGDDEPHRVGSTAAGAASSSA